ncbi:MAG: hypothetical protein KDD51_15680 [Bdellovibrionales bacterium]|nr:hypothetical protein [Bdellovibrionales bacterium]
MEVTLYLKNRRAHTSTAADPPKIHGIRLVGISGAEAVGPLATANALVPIIKEAAATKPVTRIPISPPKTYVPFGTILQELEKNSIHRCPTIRVATRSE